MNTVFINFNNVFLSQMKEINPNNMPNRNFDELYSLYVQSIGSNKLNTAISYAKQMTTLFGVVGIVLYIKTIEKIIEKMESNGENYQQLAYNTLVYLNLSQRLYELHKAGNDKLDRVFPSINWKSRKEWATMRDNLIQRTGIENLQESAVRFAVKFYQNLQK